MVVTVNNRSIGVFKVQGEFYGLMNQCPHKGGELCKGRLVGTLMSTDPVGSATTLDQALDVPLARMGVRRADRSVVSRSNDGPGPALPGPGGGGELIVTEVDAGQVGSDRW